jgi:catechol 2,3-dioxygenase-like lactoylglutathione lyase family enzyme
MDQGARGARFNLNHLPDGIPQDQDKALRFYTEVLGFAKKTDFNQGPYRWLTVASPEEPDGTELQLALNTNPASKALPAGGPFRQTGFRCAVLTVLSS